VSLEGTVAVTLNHQTPQATARAVESLRQVCPPVAAIVIVDNGSRDDSVQRLRNLEGVHLIEADDNRGFSAGCNIGIRAALARGADRVFLLNSDALVFEDTIALMERALAEHPRIGIVGPAVLDRAAPDTVQSLGIRYDRATGRMRHHGYRSSRHAGGSNLPRIVDGVSGCAMLVRREVFEATGWLAEEYFFGFEDLDLCLRARAAGFLSACVESAAVLHEGSLSIGRGSALRSYFATRNHLLLASRVSAHRPLVARGILAMTVAAFNLAHVLVAAEVPRLEGLRGFAHGLRDHLAGRYGPGSIEPGPAAHIRSPRV